jgi:hypothetical protein
MERSLLRLRPFSLADFVASLTSREAGKEL